MMMGRCIAEALETAVKRGSQKFVCSLGLTNEEKWLLWREWCPYLDLWMYFSSSRNVVDGGLLINELEQGVSGVMIIVLRGSFSLSLALQASSPTYRLGRDNRADEGDHSDVIVSIPSFYLLR